MAEYHEKRQTGYIYSIRSYQTDDIYIGSTFGTLRNRLYQHKKSFKSQPLRYISSFEIVKFEDAYIELVETYENISKMELRKHEGEAIRTNINATNKRIAGRTQKNAVDDAKEYNNKNAERIKKLKLNYAEIKGYEPQHKPIFVTEITKEAATERNKKYKENYIKRHYNGDVEAYKLMISQRVKQLYHNPLKSYKASADEQRKKRYQRDKEIKIIIDNEKV